MPAGLAPRRAGLAAAGLAAVLDQATKLWIVNDVMAPPRTIEIAPFLDIVMVWNRGAGFGLLAGGPPWVQALLAAVALAVCGALLAWLLRTDSRRLAIGLGLVVGGGAGNLIDRAARGAVADFVDLHAFGHHWPAFNLADAAIAAGVAAVLLDGLIGGRRDASLPPVEPGQRKASR